MNRVLVVGGDDIETLTSRPTTSPSNNPFNPISAEMTLSSDPPATGWLASIPNSSSHLVSSPSPNPYVILSSSSALGPERDGFTGSTGKYVDKSGSEARNVECGIKYCW